MLVMGMSSKKHKIPAIRFKGFTDAWEQRKLGDLAESFEYGLNASATIYDGENKYIRITDIDESSHLLLQKNLTSPDTDLSNASNYLLETGDLLFARTGASVGKTYQYNTSDGKVYFAGFLIRARIRPEVNSKFIFQNTLTSSYKNFIKITSQRSGQPGVNAQEYATFQLAIPSREEQNQIGTFFEKIDKTIALHQRQLGNYKELKKAMLQKMFPQDGEKVPEIRFDSFTGDWEQRKLLDMSERICVGFVGTCEQYYTDSAGIPMYRTGNLNGLYLNKDDLKYVTKEFHDKNVKSQLQCGDILIARHGDNGKAIVYNFSEEANCLNIVIIRPNSVECDYRFLAQCINSPIPSKQIKGLSAGSTQSVINTKEIEKLVVSVPSNLEEQKLLASFFSNLDNHISLHQQKVTDYQQLKKAMFQQMFV